MVGQLGIPGMAKLQMLEFLVRFNRLPPDTTTVLIFSSPPPPEDPIQIHIDELIGSTRRFIVCTDPAVVAGNFPEALKICVGPKDPSIGEFVVLGPKLYFVPYSFVELLAKNTRDTTNASLCLMGTGVHSNSCAPCSKTRMISGHPGMISGHPGMISGHPGMISGPPSELMSGPPSEMMSGPPSELMSILRHLPCARALAQDPEICAFMLELLSRPVRPVGPVFYVGSRVSSSRRGIPDIRQDDAFGAYPAIALISNEDFEASDDTLMPNEDFEAADDMALQHEHADPQRAGEADDQWFGRYRVSAYSRYEGARVLDPIVGYHGERSNADFDGDEMPILIPDRNGRFIDEINLIADRNGRFIDEAIAANTCEVDPTIPMLDPEDDQALPEGSSWGGCKICYVRRVALVLTCGHTSCRTCYIEWKAALAKRGSPPTCHMCRAPATKPQIMHI
jgi:hypothetical protein